MSDNILLSEQLDRIRRMIEAGIIRLEKTESAECLVMLRMANVAITTLIQETREIEKREHSGGRTQDRKVPNRDSGDVESRRSTSAERDIEGDGIEA